MAKPILSDPTTGRYIQADPLGLVDGPSVYNYALQNPGRFVDFMGLTMSCPALPPRGDSSWKRYPKRSGEVAFHCGYEGYLEDRPPTPDDPIGECFYDENEDLVDECHKYGYCRGTADQYSGDDWINHTIFDSGGIVKNGWWAYFEGRRKKFEGDRYGQ